MKKAILGVALAVALVGVFSGTATAGRQGGKGWDEATVKAQHFISYKLTFVGDEKAEIKVKGNANGDLALLVLDENDKPVARDISTGNDLKVTFTPSKTATYKVIVANRSKDTSGSFKLQTN